MEWGLGEGYNPITGWGLRTGCTASLRSEGGCEGGGGGGWHKASVSVVGGILSPRPLGPVVNSNYVQPYKVPLPRLRLAERRGEGGEGVWDPKVCVPKLTGSDFPNGTFRFFPRWSLWSWGGGVPPPSSGGCRPF